MTAALSSARVQIGNEFSDKDFRLAELANELGAVAELAGARLKE